MNDKCPSIQTLFLIVVIFIKLKHQDQQRLRSVQNNLFTGTIYLASSAPINQNSPQRVEYDYEYESSKSNQAKEPAEAASHYDAYIQDVQSAASGGTQKKGYSRGSGLRTIAVGSANQAKTALGNQQAAAYQAAYVAKNTLAQSAAQSSATAQAALAGKQVILSGLEQQVRDAKVSLQGEEMQLQQAKRAAQSAAQAAQQAMHQVCCSIEYTYTFYTAILTLLHFFRKFHIFCDFLPFYGKPEKKVY